MDVNLLNLFVIDNARATRNGDFPPEFVSGRQKFEWDTVNKCSTDIVKSISLEVFFYALRKSKISVSLPPNALSEKQLDDLNSQAENGKDITLDFENLKIGLKQGFGGSIDIYATADAVTVQ